MFYIALTHKETGSAYGVSLPDLPGCVSAGDSFEGAALNAIEALGLHVEGMREDGEEIPAPSRYEDIMAASDAWWQCEGATFTAVLLIENRARKVRVNINLNIDLLDAIDTQAKARGLTRSAFLASAATRELVGG
jgi:predicted RNase H-like HicB family nuclease